MAPLERREAWAMLALAVVAATLYTAGIVVGSAGLVVVGGVVTVALWFVLRTRTR
jgi:hypothetical protein